MRCESCLRRPQQCASCREREQRDLRREAAASASARADQARPVAAASSRRSVSARLTSGTLETPGTPQRVWTVAVGGETCGLCLHDFVEHEPMALVLSARLKRCVVCAGEEPSAAYVAELIQQREAQRATAGPAGLPMKIATRGEGFQPLRDLTATAGAALVAKRPLPFFELPAKDRRSHNRIADND